MAIRTRDQALQNLFAQQRQGGGNLFGGPPQAPQAPPRAPRQPSQGDGFRASDGTYDDAWFSDPNNFGSEEDESDNGIFKSIGEEVAGGLGTVLGGAAKKLDWVGNLGMLGAEELSEWVSGDEFGTQKNDDGTLNEFGKQGNWEKLNDPSYGFRKLVGDVTGINWVDATIGFVGDVAFDPTSYLGGPVAKSALAMGKAGRGALVQKAAKLGMGDEVAEKVGKYGVARLTDAERVTLGVKKAGVYWGVGGASVRIPGTKTFGKGLERTFAATRVNTVGRLAGRMPERGTDALKDLRRITTTGRTIDGTTPAMAGRMLNMVDSWKAGSKTAADPWNRKAQKTMSGWDDRLRNSVTEELESAAVRADGSIDLSRLSPPARQWAAQRDEIYAAAKAAGVDIGDLGPTYVPHRWTKEAWDFFTKNNPEGKSLLAEITDPNTAAATRKLLAGTSKTVDGVTLNFGDASIKNINEVFSAGFPDSGVAKWLETDAVRLMDRYITEMADNVGVARLLSEAFENGVIKNINDFSTDMIRNGANTVKNKQVAKYLADELVRREGSKAALITEAHRMSKEIGRMLNDELQDQMKMAGRDVKPLQADILVLKAKVDADDMVGVRAELDGMRQRTAAAYEAVTAQMTDIEMSIAALDARVVAAEAADNSAAVAEMAALIKKSDELEAKVVEAGRASAYAELLDERFGLLLGQAQRAEEIADSPQLLKEFVKDLMGDDIIVSTQPEVKRHVIDSPRVRELEAELKRFDDPGWTATVNRIEMDAMADAHAGQVGAAADALDEAADKMLRQQQSIMDDIRKVREGQLGWEVPQALQARAAKLKAKRKQLNAALLAKSRKAQNLKDDAGNLSDQFGIPSQIGIVDDELRSLIESGGGPAVRASKLRLSVRRADWPEYFAELMAKQEERVELGLRLLDLEDGMSARADKVLRQSGTEEGMVRLADDAVDAAMEADILRSQINDLDGQINLLAQDPVEARLLKLENPSNDLYQMRHRVAAMRSSASDLRNLQPPATSAQKARNMADVLADVRRIESHGKIVGELTGGTVTSTTRAARSLRSLPEIEAAIEAKKAELLEVVKRESLIPETGPMPDFGGPASPDELRVVQDFIGVLAEAETSAKKEYYRLKNLRRKLFPQQRTDSMDGGKWSTPKPSEDADLEKLYRQREEIEAVLQRDDAITLGQSRLLDTLPKRPRQSKPWMTEEQAASTNLADGAVMGSADDVDFDELAGLGTRNGDLGQQLARDVKEAKDLWIGRDGEGGARQAHKAAAQSLGINQKELEQALPFGNWGDLILFDPAPVNGQASWAKRGVAVTPDDLRDQVHLKFKGDWEAARKSNPGAVGKATGFRNLTHTQAAKLLGGKSKYFQAGKGPISKLPKEVAESGNALALSAVVRKMKPAQRERLWKAARDASQVRRNADRVPRTKIEREIADLVNEAAPQRKIAEMLKAEADRIRNGPMPAMGQVRDKYRNIAADQGVDAAKSEVDELTAAAARRAADVERVSDNATTAKIAMEDDLGRLERTAERLEAVDTNLGKKVADEVKKGDSVRQIDDFMLQESEANLKWAKDRKKDLAKLKGRASKLATIGRQDDATRATLGKRLTEMDAVMDHLSVDDQSPGIMAVGRLMDSYFDQLVKIDGAQSGIDDMAAVWKKAKTAKGGKKNPAEGGFALGMERQMLDGWQQLDAKIFPEFRDMAIDADLNRLLTNWRSALQDDLDLKWFDEATQIFKSYATATPGFHIRNFMGATFMNFSDGVSVKNTRKGNRMWHEYSKDPDNYIKNLTDPRERMAFEAVFGSGAGGSFAVGEIGTGAAARFGKGLQSNKLTRGSRKLGEDFVEGPVRLALALDTTLNGGNLSDAMARVKRIHFDYSDVSSFDQKMKRVVPFYMFMSRNLPLQVQQMWAKPRAYNTYNHFMNNFDDGEDSDLMPQYLKDAGAIVFKQDWFGDTSKKTILAPDLQHNNLSQDLLAFRNPIDGLLASGNPVGARPIEAILNRSGFRDGKQLFFDYQQDEYGNWDEKSDYRKGLERVLYVAEGVLPPIGSVQGLLGVDVLGGEASERAADKATQKRVNYIGLQIKQLGENEEDYERRRRLAELAGV